jgi:hypothetical protein
MHASVTVSAPARVDPRVLGVHDRRMADVWRDSDRIGPNKTIGMGRGRLDLAVAALAAHQHGVVAVAQMLEIGLTYRMIRRRVACGWLHRIHRGVHAVGHANISREGRWMAATLACGPGAVLSHRSAAAHFGLRNTSASLVDVTSPARGGRRRSGILAHHADALTSADVTEVRAIPCTTVARTIFDLSAVLNRDALEYALHHAQLGPNPINFAELAALLDRLPRRSGAPLLRSLVGRPAGLTDAEANSKMERAFLALCRRADLPATASERLDPAARPGRRPRGRLHVAQAQARGGN